MAILPSDSPMISTAKFKSLPMVSEHLRISREYNTHEWWSVCTCNTDDVCSLRTQITTIYLV